MKPHLSILAGTLAALCLPLQAFAQKTQTDLIAEGDFGPKVKWATITEVKIVNLQGKPLGRIQDLVLDLTDARVVEILVVSDQTLRFGGKTVGVPPEALIPDAQNKVYQIDMSQDAFADAPKFDRAKWADSTTPEQVATAYHYFGKQPYFSAPGAAGKTTVAGAERKFLGYLEGMTKIANMGVKNLKGERLGDVQTLVVDVPNGMIRNVFINAGNVGTILKFSTAIPPESLSFNAKRDGLLLDDTKVEYANEPHVIFQDGASGKAVSYREEPAVGEVVKAGLVQGTSSSDINMTAQIYKSIQGSKLDAGEKVEVATLNGRVTLRGIVSSEATKDSIAAIAVAAVSLANVSNQISVMSQTQASH